MSNHISIETVEQLVCDKNAFPDEAAKDIARLLSHHMAINDTARDRGASIGLLVAMVHEGEFVTTDQYETRRAEETETWPSSSTLSERFGSWLKAVEASCQFWFEGGPTRIPADYRHAPGGNAPESQAYRPGEIKKALIRARSDLSLPEGHWPNQWEYQAWARTNRKIYRKTGKPCRLPGLKQIRKAFGTYTDAIQAVERTLKLAR